MKSVALNLLLTVFGLVGVLLSGSGLHPQHRPLPAALVGFETSASPNEPDGGPPHSDSCDSCTPRCETRTIYVPVWETQYQRLVRTCYRPEVRTHSWTVNRTVCEQVPEQQQYTVMVPQQRNL